MGLIGLAVLVATVGRHPLMVADKRGASRTTGVRAGRIWGLSRWGLICHPLPHPSPPVAWMCTMRTAEKRALHLPPKKRGCYIKSVPWLPGQLREIRHWHLAFVWWPEIERLDFRCLELNCTAGMQLTLERRKTWMDNTKVGNQN